MILRLAVVGGLLALINGPFGQGAGAQEGGADIAARWCANCHATGVNQQRRAQDTAPTFDDIGRRLSTGQIEATLTAPHDPMRGIDLTRQQIATMVEFIKNRGQ